MEEYQVWRDTQLSGPFKLAKHEMQAKAFVRQITSAPQVKHAHTIRSSFDQKSSKAT
jgi:hypothetical protein